MGMSDFYTYVWKEFKNNIETFVEIHGLDSYGKARCRGGFDCFGALFKEVDIEPFQLNINAHPFTYCQGPQPLKCK